MGTLRTGRRYEMLFGPGLDPASATAASIAAAFERVRGCDAQAIILSAPSDGLTVIGTDAKAAIDAGREVCSIHCRVFDREANQDVSSALELSRQVAAPVWMAPIANYDPRSAAPRPRNSKAFKIASRGPATAR